MENLSRLGSMLIAAPCNLSPCSSDTWIITARFLCWKTNQRCCPQNIVKNIVKNIFKIIAMLQLLQILLYNPYKLMYRFLYTKQKMYLRNSFCGTNHIDKSIYKYFVLKLIIVLIHQDTIFGSFTPFNHSITVQINVLCY